MPAIKPKEIDHQELKELLLNDPMINRYIKMLCYLDMIHLPKMIIHKETGIIERVRSDVHKESVKKIDNLIICHTECLINEYKKRNSVNHV